VLDMMSWLSEADSEAIAESTGNFSFHPQADRLFSQLTDLLQRPYDERHTGYEFLPFQDESDYGLYCEGMKLFRRHDETDMLWLSATEFVSCHSFYAHSHELELHSAHSYAVSVGRC
jgi:hypothetical protein